MNRLILVLAALLFCALVPAQKSVVMLDRPAGCILDKANLISPSDARDIGEISDRCRQRYNAPIVVVTIPSLKSVQGISVEWYASALFNAWQVGDVRTNRGVLILVSLADRKARIEMGKGWGFSRDSDCLRIMDIDMIPHFRREDYSQGIVAGVIALESLIRLGDLPKSGSTGSPPDPMNKVWFFLGVLAVILVVSMVVDLYRRGRDGWAWAFLEQIGHGLSALLSSPRYDRHSHFNDDDDDNPRSSFGSGFFGGGSSGSSGTFSGGSSGGGGASGSW